MIPVPSLVLVGNLNLGCVSICLLYVGMQGTLREFEDWLEDSVPDAVMIAYEKALARLEECLPFEDTLVRYISKQELVKLA